MRRTTTSLAAVLAVWSLLAAGAAPAAAATHPQTASEEPSEEPSEAPTDEPTEEPSADPSEEPSEAPTDEPTDEPSEAPVSGLAVRTKVRTAAQVGPALSLDGSGFGHGVGLSQYGSYALGLAGRSAEQILTYYYRGTEVLDRLGASNVPIRVGVQPDRTTSTIVAPVGGDAKWQTCPTVDGRQRCGKLLVDGEQLVQPAGETWRVGYVVTDPDDAPTFGIRTADGREIEAGRGAKLRLVNVDEAGHLLGPVESASSSVEFFYGFHEFVETGGSFDVVHQVPSLELYLRGLAEVPSAWGREAPAALQAQAIAGRTYAVRLRQGGIKSGCSCHILSTPANQNWTAGQKETGQFGSLWKSAVNSTQGRVVAYQGELISTFYSSSHGGRSENIEDSWAYGSTPFPYLRSVDDPWSLEESVDGVPVGNSRRAWTVRVANRALGRLVGLDTVSSVDVRDRTEGGTPRTLAITGFRGGEPASVTWTGPGAGRKDIAGANLRLDLRDVEGTKLPSSQIRRIGFDQFGDDDGSLFEYAISFASQAGIAQGVAPGTFDPTAVITRGQMAQFLVRTAAFTRGDASFPDVDPGGPFADAIGDVARAEVTEGFPDGTFRPGRPVTRGQFATFLARTFDLTASGAAPFDDVPSDGVHAASIAALAETGITDGCDQDSFCADLPVTRGQMAELLLGAVRHRTGG